MTGNGPGSQVRRRGRPVGFDRSLALRRAMHLFWEHGFEGTSFDDIVGTMGISPSSFYAAFGSKERLYREAVDAYAAEAFDAIVGVLDAAGDTRTAVQGVLRTAAAKLAEGGEPAGCMISVACINVPPKLEPLRQHLTGQRLRADAAMAARIRRGMDAGDTPPGTDADALARFYSALLRGMAVHARDGARREQLDEIVDIGMRAWPDGPRERPRRP